MGVHHVFWWFNIFQMAIFRSALPIYQRVKLQRIWTSARHKTSNMSFGIGKYLKNWQQIRDETSAIIPARCIERICIGQKQVNHARNLGNPLKSVRQKWFQPANSWRCLAADSRPVVAPLARHQILQHTIPWNHRKMRLNTVTYISALHTSTWITLQVKKSH